MTELAHQKCVACRGGEPPMSDAEIAQMKAHVPDWKVVEQDGIKRLQRVFTFENFVKALDFTNRVGTIAEEEGHHPAILTEWGKVAVTWWTHKIRGLHRNDFIMAAKADRLYLPSRA